MRRLAPFLLLSAAIPFSFLAAASPRQTIVHIEPQASTYRYEEPGLMRLTGRKLGIAGRVTTIQTNDSFVRAEGRFAGGTVDYDSVSTGSDTGEPDYLLEGRILAGRTFAGGGSDIGWFAGFGYRYLLNDSSDHVTTTGNTGYRRESNYFYLPIGFEVRRPLSDNRALSFEIEYDHLLVGTQKSYLEPTVSNQQRRGKGFRGGVDYQFHRSWSIGAFANVWRIAESDKVPCGGGGFVCFEPENRTREVGLRMRYSIR